MFGQPQCVARSRPASTSRVADELALHARELRRRTARRATGSPRASRFLRARSANSLWRNASSQRWLACATRSRHSAISRSGSQSAAPELLGARERDGRSGSLLVDGPLALARDVAGARVQDGHVAERAREPDEVLRAEGVGVERLVERRVEVDDAGHVDDRVDGARAARARSASSRPQRGRPMSPSMGSTLSRRKASKPSPYCSRRGASASLVAMSLQKRASRRAACAGGRRGRCGPRRGTGRGASTRRPCRGTRCRRGRRGVRRPRSASRPGWRSVGSSVAEEHTRQADVAPRLTEGRAGCQCGGGWRCERAFAERFAARRR